MKQEQLKTLKIKNIVKSFLDEDLTPLDIRLQVAKGLIPLETKELVTAFFYFLFDSEQEVRAAAKDSLDTLPESMLLTFLSLDVPGQVLDFFAKVKKDSDECLKEIILNKNTSAATLKSLAAFVPEKLAVIIAENHRKIIEDPEIVNVLEKNSNVHVSLIEKLRSFLEHLSSYGEEPALEEQKADETLSGVEGVNMPPAAEAVPEKGEEEEEAGDYAKSEVEAPTDEQLENYTAEEIEELKLNTYQRIQGMSIAEKIQEALKGNRESRSILIKDSNKLVSSAVIKSPKVTEDEIVKITASRNISDEIMRLVCMKDEWLRNYQIKLNLVNNPKTPFRTTLKFMNFLHKRDLVALSKSKMVPAQVSLTAKKMLLKKK